jgi:hypothetical protein
MAAAIPESLKVVHGEDGSFPGVHLTLLYHCTMPELRGTGTSPREAAATLLQYLSASADNVVDAWHRAELERVGRDVRAFLDRLGTDEGRLAEPRPRR